MAEVHLSREEGRYGLAGLQLKIVDYREATWSRFSWIATCCVVCFDPSKVVCCSNPDRSTLNKTNRVLLRQELEEGNGNSAIARNVVKVHELVADLCERPLAG